MPKEKYKYLEHTADAEFQAFGNSLNDAFENAALAMLNLMCKTDKIKTKRKKEILIKDKDLKALLYNWLEELLFLLDSENFLTAKVKNLKISGKEGNYKLAAVVSGDNASAYKFFGEVKAATYNDMLIREEKIKGKRKFIIQVVVDM
jgi:SHS2 domain-containing protein